MARPQKEGLDYFSMDVEKDTKLKLLKGKYGVLGFGVYVELLQYIYRQGYYTVRDEDNMLLFLSETGLKEEETMVILEFMLDKDLFNRSLFEKYRILTSRGIQKRYAEGTKKRKDVVVDSQYRIITGYPHIQLSDTLIELKEEETELKEKESTQSKVKESKGKKNTQDVRAGFNNGLDITPDQREELIQDYGEQLITQYEQELINYIAIIPGSEWKKKKEYSANHAARIRSRLSRKGIQPRKKPQPQAKPPPQEPKKNLSEEQKQAAIGTLAATRARLRGQTTE